MTHDCVCVSDGFGLVSENRPQFAVFPACVRNILQADSRRIPGIRCCFFRPPMTSPPFGRRRGKTLQDAMIDTVNCQERVMGNTSSTNKPELIRRSDSVHVLWGPHMSNCPSNWAHLLSFGCSFLLNRTRCDCACCRNKDTGNATTVDGSG